MVSQQYCLKWKHHNSNIQSTFAILRDKARYCDVTIWCDGAGMRAHRAVLASCSDLFAELLADHDMVNGDPAIVLTDAVHAQNLKHILTFMYTGEVRVHHGELAGLLKTAEELRIKGLADVSWAEPLTSSDSSCSEPANKNDEKSDSSSNVQMISISARSNDESCEISDENLSAAVLQETLSDANNTISETSVKSPVNGSVVSPSEPEKKRRGRPTLDSIISDPPKRPKMLSTPNILRKSKMIEHRNERVFDTSPDWPATSKKQESDEVMSEYSEASLDGRDITQFLHTTIEEEPIESSLKYSEKSLPVTLELDSSPPPKDMMFSDVVKLSDYLISGRRTQFWAEDYVKRVMEAVFCRELEMKQAAEILGVSYGTLYGRYRDTFGCINRPYRAREFWSENSEILAKLLRKEITFTKAADILNISTQMLFSYVGAFDTAVSQKELFDIAQDPNVTLAFIKQKLYPKNKLEIDNINEDISIIDSDKETESYNRLSDILRKHHDMQEAKDKEFNQEKNSILIDSPPETKPIIIEEIPSPEKKPDDNEKETSSNTVNEPSSSNVVAPKKLPMIRVANLKFLKGEPDKSSNEKSVKSNSNLLTTPPFPQSDLKMLSSKRKVSFQEIAMSLKHNNILVEKKNTTINAKPPTSVT